MSGGSPAAGSLPPVGVVEGFYGRPWSAAEREAFLDFAAEAGLDFYLYAPKGDPFLRRRWRDPYPADAARALAGLAEHARRRGVAFGVGLSPYELYRDWTAESRRLLEERLALFRDLDVATLGIFFDDMKGDQERLAELQAEIAHFAGERMAGAKIVVCPTYYSDDPVLDRMFGARPARYLETLGRTLHPAIDVVWTGPRICSKEYPPDHLAAVARALGRKLWLWDNYPVNDGPRMCPFLHLGAFEGRAGAVAPYLSAHAINPMNQAALSRIPLLTEVEARARARDGSVYEPEAAWRRAAVRVAGEALARRIEADREAFATEGWNKLGPDGRARLAEAYAPFAENPAGAEILAWIRGESQVTDAETFLGQ